MTLRVACTPMKWPASRRSAPNSLGFQATLINGPVLTLPLAHSNLQFNPQSLVPLGDVGTVYPTISLQDAWGTLTVESGGVLRRKQPSVAAVSAIGFNSGTLHGQGFVLVLNPGWTVQRGPRKGDWPLEKPAKPFPEI